MITVKQNGFVWTLPAEHIGSWLAVIPSSSAAGDGGRKWTGSFVVAHTGNGRVIPRLAGCASCMRAAAVELAGLDVDWSKLVDDSAANAKALTGDEYEAIVQVAAKWDAHCVTWSCEYNEESC